MGNIFGDNSGRLIEEDGQSGLGPLGLGDPDDLTLRHEEVLLLIPKYQLRAAEAVKCLDASKAYSECFDKTTIPSLSCKEEIKIYGACTAFWSTDAEYREEITNEYLAVRSEYRKTGRRRLKRALRAETYVAKSQLQGFQVEL